MTNFKQRFSYSPFMGDKTLLSINLSMPDDQKTQKQKLGHKILWKRMQVNSPHQRLRVNL